jgi:carbonic anhydrase
VCPNELTRRRLIGSGTGAALAVPVAAPIAAFVAGCGEDEEESSGGASDEDEPVARKPPPKDGDEALDRLLEGNRHFVEDDESEVGRHTVERVELAEGQHPFAVVLGCADSRVPPEVIFDQGLGQLFVVRVAGNTIQAPAIVGSIEFAVEEFGSVLVMVLGHESCGAVDGAVTVVEEDATLPGAIADVTAPIEPVVRQVADESPDLKGAEFLDACVQANAVAVAEDLPRRSEAIAKLVDSGKLKIVAAEYKLETGEVIVL